jgi:rare lipoprotein A
MAINKSSISSLGIGRSYSLRRVAAALRCNAANFSSPRGASSEVNLGSRMRRLIAALVLCLLDIPVLAEDCVASVYAVGDSSQPGTKTASGISLNDNAMTAAHKSLPFGSKVQVTNKKNGHAVTVTVTDRGPYVKGRCIDLSKAGAGALGFAGLAPVTVVMVSD